MQQSYRSPRQPVRTRSKPYTRRQPPPRSGSIIATIRNIVTAPLSWFSTTDEFEDTPGKRRRAPVSHSNADASDEHRSVKRQKVASQPPQPPQGYLDPPVAMFQPHSKPKGTSQDPTSIVFPSSTSTNVNTQGHQPEHGRHSLVANVWSRRGQSREVSMDNLQSRLITRDATMIPLPVSREASFSSVPRDSSVGPVRAPFRMRTTLSPIPVGSDYGPNPKRRERDPSEPPPLTALMSNPIFVKPPLNQHPTHRSQSAQPTTTLGALAQTSRAHYRISPRQSSLHLNDPPHDPSLRTTNASEIALSELAIYRTPLLPTRLRSSETIPEMFKPKKVHAVVPMKNGKPDLPRLGTGRKKKGKKEDTRKPYSAHGGVKKLLLRRKMEEETERSRVDHVMDTFDQNAGDGAPTSAATESAITPLPEPDVPQRRVYARETSSLRVGRSRMNRPDRPTTARPSRTKFSAAFEDDDSVDQKEQDVQRPETKPMFEPPRDFTFARDTTSVADVTPPEPAKEPPIPALPFSLTPDPSKSTFSIPPALPATQSAVPVISLSPPTPQKSDSSSGIPNFFANSSLLTRTSFPSTTVLPSGNLFGASSINEAQPAPLVTSDQVLTSTGSKDFTAASNPPEITQPISPVAAAPTIPSPAISIFPTPSTKVEAPEPTPPPLCADPLEDSFPAPAPPPPATQPPSSLFGGLPPHNPAPVSTDASTPSTASTTEPNPAAVSLELKGSTPSMFSFGNSSETPFVEFGATNSTEGPKLFSSVRLNPTLSPGKSTKPPAVAQSEEPKETKPGFSFTFKFGAPATAPEKSAAPHFGDPSQGAPNSGIFTFGANSNTTDTQKPPFGSFPRSVTPPREEEEVRMEESPTRVVEVATPRPNENSFFGGRVLNFGQNNGSTNSPFNFGTASGDSNHFGSKLEEKPKPATGFTFSSSGSGFDQSSPAFTFGKPDNSPQPATPSSPFTFGASKLPEINTFGAGQTTSSSPFSFGQRSESSPSGFAFGQQSPVATNSPFAFSQGQTLAPPSFGQPQNGSVPSSPSTFNQSLPFGFGPTTPASTSNPFSFQSPSPITTTPSAPGFTFSQQPPAQTQPSTPVSPFPVPGSPQPPGGSLFSIGASPTVQSPGPRVIKKLPNRRGGGRR